MGNVLDWPAMFYWFATIALSLAGVAVWLFRKKPAGAETAFHDGGFTLRVQSLLLNKRVYQLEWREIEEVKLVEAPRGGDVLSFRLTYDAAIREGLIEPTTREDAAKMLLRREVAFPIKLTKTGTADATARFTLSAENAGARLAEQASFNVVVFARRVWSVEWSGA